MLKKISILALFNSCILFCFSPLLAITFQEAVDSAIDGVVELEAGIEYTGGAYFGSDVIVNGNGAVNRVVGG